MHALRLEEQRQDRRTRSTTRSADDDRRSRQVSLTSKSGRWCRTAEHQAPTSPKKIHSTEWYANDSVLIWNTMPAIDASSAMPQTCATACPGTSRELAQPDDQRLHATGR